MPNDDDLTLLDVARKHGNAYASRNEEIFRELMIHEGFTLHGVMKSAYQEGFQAGLRLFITGDDKA